MDAIRVEDAGCAIGMAPIRCMTGPQPAAHRLAFDPAGPGNGFQRHTLLTQTCGFGEAGVTAFLRRPRPPLYGTQRPFGFEWSGRFRVVLLQRQRFRLPGSRSGGPAQVAVMMLENAGQKSLVFRSKCCRSATWVASGVQRAAPSGQAPARSRATTEMPGCFMSHAAKVSALRSGDRAMSRRRCRHRHPGGVPQLSRHRHHRLLGQRRLHPHQPTL